MHLEMKFKHVIFFFSLLITPYVSSQTSLPKDTVLKRAMDAAEKYNSLVEKYEAEIYMRTYVQTLKKNFLYKYTHHVPHFVLHNPNNDESVIETISTLKYEFPNKYVQNIQYVTGTLTRKKDIELIPFNLLNINVYGESTNDETFFMPIRTSSAKYYTYELNKIYTENNKNYYTIQFSPIYKNAKLLKGFFIVEQGTWRIIQFKGEGIDIFADFSFEITMGNQWIMNFLPVHFIIYQTTPYLGNKVASRYLANINYKEIKLRESTEKKPRNLNISDYYRIKLDSVPVYNDSVFWNTKRPIPLQAKEKEVLEEFEAQQAEKLKKRNDSTTSNKKLQQFAQRIVMDSEYKHGTMHIGYGGLLNPALIEISTTDGLIYRQRFSFHMDLHRDRNFQLKAYGGYNFKRKEFFSDITSVWNYDPSCMKSVTLSVGNGTPSYSSRFVEQIQDSLINKGLKFEDISVNYFNDYYLKLFNTLEPLNGFLVSAGVEYHIREGKRKRLTLKETRSTNTLPLTDMFGTQRSFAPFIRLKWTPEQYYRYQGSRKIYVRSRFPTFKLELSKSFKDILGSTSEYNRIEFDINQQIPIGLMRTFNYHLGAGKYTNQKTEYFVDFIYFARNNFPENFEDGIGGTFNLLSRRFYHASEFYAQAHFMFETPFMLLNNIRFVSKIADKERIYFSQLYTPQIKSYNEFGYGIGNRFFNGAFFISFHKLDFRSVGVRATLGL